MLLNTQFPEGSRATALGSVPDCVSVEIIKLHQYPPAEYVTERIAVAPQGENSQVEEESSARFHPAWLLNASGPSLG
jgi:hypothetical protein